MPISLPEEADQVVRSEATLTVAFFRFHRQQRFQISHMTLPMFDRFFGHACEVRADHGNLQCLAILFHRGLLQHLFVCSFGVRWFHRPTSNNWSYSLIVGRGRS